MNWLELISSIRRHEYYIVECAYIGICDYVVYKINDNEFYAQGGNYIDEVFKIDAGLNLESKITIIFNEKEYDFKVDMDKILK